MEKEFYTMKIKPATRRVLDKIGRKTETYDEIIMRVLREAGYVDDNGNVHEGGRCCD